MRLAKTVSILTTIVAMGGAMALVEIVEDWFGLANTFATTGSIIVRHEMEAVNLNALDAGVERVSRENWAWAVKEMLLMTPAGKAVTVFASLGLVTEAVFEAQVSL